ncbi:MAG: Crp/Fnr family transcriptional regulator [Coriobacteriaceae bacterium]|nr:Crp/Fnr family transcriptional regulator [Coriobacteriaceae bacterium]
MDIAQFLRDNLGIQDQQVVECLTAGAAVVELERGEVLMHVGEAQRCIYILSRGIVRTALFDVNGHDATDCIIERPGSVIAPCADLSSPSPAQVEALTESEVISVRIDAILGLLQTSLPFAQLYIALLSEAWQMHWDVKRVVSQQQARERCLWFLKEHPGVIDAVPHRYVASYLGMTPVTLSRVRNS